eukprot:760310-Heterocapsa_arctica.AAC.1
MLHAPSQPDEMLLTWENGKPLRRQKIQAILEQAAAAAGVDPQFIGSHSFRFRGATALWNAYKDSGLVRRWG